MSGIKSWPNAERPRERLQKSGAASLSDAELLAILLRSGTLGTDVTNLARNLLNKFDGLRGILSANWGTLAKSKGLGPAKISTLLVLSEITKRHLREEMVTKTCVRDPESVFKYLQSSLRDHKREIFKLLYLNKANEIIGEKDLFEGTIDAAHVHTREIVKTALEMHATALILIHNHPSGKAKPSGDDITLTKKIQSACNTVSIQILDHLIIGNNQHFSFRENGLL